MSASTSVSGVGANLVPAAVRGDSSVEKKGIYSGRDVKPLTEKSNAMVIGGIILALIVLGIAAGFTCAGVAILKASPMLNGKVWACMIFGTGFITTAATMVITVASCAIFYKQISASMGGSSSASH